MYLLIEILLIFIALPGAIAVGWINIGYILVPLYLVMFYTVWILGRGKDGSIGDIWEGLDKDKEKEQFRLIIIRFLLTSLFLIALILVFLPSQLFLLPKEHTGVWLLILIFYPILSVLPQEIIYRHFFFRRYKVFFGDKTPMLIASAVAFSFMHIVFHNYLSVLITLFGGLYFSNTYQKTQSLRLVSLEHSLYGQLLFTIGYGDFFLYGKVLEAIH